MKTQEVMEDMLALLGCGVNAVRPAGELIRRYQTGGSEAEAAENHEKRMHLLYQLCRAHFVEALAGTVLKSAGVLLSAEWEQSIAKAIRKEILFDAERQKLFGFMEQKGIWYLPLKGIILKDLYPGIGMRQMSDNDILFDEAYAEEIRQFMTGQGYEVLSFGKIHHDVYEKKPVYNFEMHRRLYPSAHNIQLEMYYENIKERLLPQEKGCFGQQMSDEDFYIFMVCHAYKHYKGYGTGIRTLLDFYVYLQAKKETLDFTYIEKECELLSVAEFERRNRILCDKAFMPSGNIVLHDTDDQPDRSEKSGKPAEQTENVLTDEELVMLSYYLGSGVYGNSVQMVKNKLAEYKKEGKKYTRLAYIRKRLFPGMEVYQYYPFSGHKLTLPLCWIYRMIDMLKDPARRRGVRQEASALQNSNIDNNVLK